VEQEGEYLDPSIEEEAEKFEAKSSGVDIRDKFKRLMKDATFVLGIMQFLNANPANAESHKPYIEKFEGDIMRTTTFHLCDEAMPQSYIRTYSAGAYELEKDDAFHEKLSEWCKKGDTRSLYYVNLFSSHKPTPKDDPKQIYEDYRKSNFIELERLEKRYSVNLETIKKIESDFLAGLKEGGYIKPEYSQLKKKEYTYQMTAEDVVMDVEYIVNNLPNGDKIPWDIKEEFIKDLTQYLVMNVSEMVSWTK